jgi:hypothetical protein
VIVRKYGLFESWLSKRPGQHAQVLFYAKKRGDAQMKNTLPSLQSAELSIVESALSSLHVLLPDYLSRARVPFPEGILPTLEEITSVGKEIQRFFQEGLHPTYHEIPWRVAFLVALYANMVLEAEIEQKEATVLLCRMLHEIGLPVSAVMIAEKRYCLLCMGSDVEYVDEHVLPLEMRALLISQ